MNNLDLIPFDAHPFKPVKTIPAQEKSTWLGKHVKWLKEERHGWNKVGIIAYATLETFLLTLSVLGLIMIRKEIRESRRQDARAEYFLKAEQATPPSEHPIELKSKTRTFNHVQEFAIKEGILWMRQRHAETEWTPVYFDGFIDGHVPQSVDCDGANLIVLDETNAVHYKKVLKEFRPQDIKDSDRAWLIQAGADLEKDKYIAIDKGQRDNWKEKWFSLPYLHSLVNLFTGKRLKLPSDAKAWAISQRGRYNDYLEDQNLRQHEANVGVTTLYVLDPKGKDIYKFDPWSPKHVKISIPLPETSTLSFEAETISVSASMIMAIGYESQKDNPKKTLQIYTRLADIDSEGWNPGLNYDYFDHPENPDIHVIPLSQWVSHSLTIEKGDFITKKITIVQTGAGNDARELRVEGQHQGQKGFFFKKVNDEEWLFEPLDDEVTHEISEANALSLELDVSGKFQTTVQDYQSTEVKMKNINSKKINARLLNFGQRSFHSKLILEIDQQEYELDIYKKKTLKNFIGFKGDSYELVIPEELHDHPLLMKSTKNQKVIPLKVIQEQGKLTLQSQQGSSFAFTTKAGEPTD